QVLSERPQIKRLVRVFTNDVDHARSVCSKINGQWEYFFDDGPLERMITESVAAEYFVSSNRTLAFWICRLREAKDRTMAPLPFNKKGVLALGREYQLISDPY